MAETFFDSDLRVSGKMTLGGTLEAEEIETNLVKIGDAKAAKITVSDSAPTSSTAGEAGDMILHVSGTTYKLYVCAKVEETTYTWKGATLS